MRPCRSRRPPARVRRDPMTAARDVDDRDGGERGCARHSSTSPSLRTTVHRTPLTRTSPSERLGANASHSSPPTAASVDRGRAGPAEHGADAQQLRGTAVGRLQHQRPARRGRAVVAHPVFDVVGVYARLRPGCHRPNASRPHRESTTVARGRPCGATRRRRHAVPAGRRTRGSRHRRNRPAANARRRPRRACRRPGSAACAATGPSIRQAAPPSGGVLRAEPVVEVLGQLGPDVRIMAGDQAITLLAARRLELADRFDRLLGLARR